MISKRAKQLEQLGITTYQLRHPARLMGESAVHLSSATKLILVIQPEDNIPDRLLNDILSALQLTPSELMIIQQEQLMMLPRPLGCQLWLAGEALINLAGPQTITSPALSRLQHSVTAKRNLWQQIAATYD